MKKQLERVRGWALARMASGAEPPWAWYQYMKLVEASEVILDGMSAVRTASSPRAAARSRPGLRLVDAAYPRDSARSPRRRKLPSLPM